MALLEDVKEGTEYIMLSIEKSSIEKISTFNNLIFIFNININFTFIIKIFLSKTGQSKRVY